MNEDFVTFEIAKKLREKGFDRPTLFMYDSEGKLPNILDDVFTNDENVCYRAPNIYEVLKWLREEKNLFIDISLCAEGYYGMVYLTIFPKDEDFSDGWLIDGKYQTYEKAALAGIEYTLYNLI